MSDVHDLEVEYQRTLRRGLMFAAALGLVLVCAFGATEHVRLETLRSVHDQPQGIAAAASTDHLKTYLKQVVGTPTSSFTWAAVGLVPLLFMACSLVSARCRLPSLDERRINRQADREATRTRELESHALALKQLEIERERLQAAADRRAADSPSDSRRTSKRKTTPKPSNPS